VPDEELDDEPPTEDAEEVLLLVPTSFSVVGVVLLLLLPVPSSFSIVGVGTLVKNPVIPFCQLGVG